jgi:hypothetical protein
LGSVVGGGGGVAGATAGAGAAGAALGSAGSVFLNQFKGFNENPPERFLDPTLPLRLHLPLRVTLDLCLDMIIVNNYILNEDINI